MLTLLNQYKQEKTAKVWNTLSRRRSQSQSVFRVLTVTRLTAYEIEVEVSDLAFRHTGISPYRDGV